MGSRSRLLAASSSSRSSPGTPYILRRRSSIDRALDILGARDSSTPSLRSRVCRPVPIVLLMLLLAGTTVGAYFTYQAVTANALGFRNFLMENVFDGSHAVAQKIYEVSVNTTDTVLDSIEPTESESNATANSTTANAAV